MNKSDEQIALQSDAGNAEATTLLIDRYYEKIYGYLRRQTLNDADAADLTQKAFSKAWQSLSQFRQDSQFSTWLYRIAYHTYVDWVRNQTRRQQRETRWWELNHLISESPFEDYEEQETAGRIFALVEELSEEERRAIHLHYYEHLTLEQTAAILAVSVSTVKNRLRQGIALVRERNAHTERELQFNAKKKSL